MRTLSAPHPRPPAPAAPGDPLRRVGPGHGARPPWPWPPGAAASPAARQPHAPAAGRRARRRGTTTAAPAALHVARVERLVVGRRVRVGHEDRGQARRGHLEHRSAGARDRQVGGRERVREWLDVGVQVVVRRRAERVEAARAARRGRACPHACRTAHGRGGAERIERRLVEPARARASRRRRAGRARRRRSRSAPRAAARSACPVPARHRPAATTYCAPVAALDREGQEHAPGEAARAGGW